MFKKGLEESLPISSARTEGVFYVTEDTNKIVLGSAVWEDTNQVKEEIYTEIKKDEKVLAAALTKLNDEKQNKLVAGSNIVIEDNVISVLSDFKINYDYDTVEYPDTENEEVVFVSVEVGQEFGRAINVLENNLVTLVNETLKNEEIISAALTQFDDMKVDYDEFSSTIDSLNSKISNNQQFEGIGEKIEELENSVNDLTDRVSDAESNTSGLIDRVSTIESTMAYADAVDSIIDGITERIVEIENNASDLTDRVSTVESHIETIQEELVDIDEVLPRAITELHETMDELSGLTREIANKADKSEIPSLEGYATEEWVEAKGYLTAADVEKPDVTGFVTEEYLNQQGFATESWVEDKHYLTEHQSLEGYAKETYVDTKVAALVSGAPETLDTLAEIATALQTNSGIVETLNSSITNKADKSELSGITENAAQIEAIKGDIGTIDIVISKAVTELSEVTSTLSGKSDVNHTHEEYITEDILSNKGFATESWVEGKNYLTEHQDISDFATKDELNSKADSSELSGYSVTSHTHEEFTTLQNNIDAKQDVITDLDDIRANVSNNVSEIEVINDKLDTIDITVAKSLTQLKESIEDINVELGDKSDFEHNHDDLYYSKDEVNTLLDEKSNYDHTHEQYLTEIPEEYITASELEAKGYLTAADVEQPDVTGFVTEEYLNQQNYAKKSDIPSVDGLATKAEVNAKADSSHTHSEFITLQSNIDKKADSSVLSGYSLTSHTHSQYLTSANIANKQDTISDLEDIRNGAEKGATAVQPNDLNDYAKTSQIPSLDGYAKETYVDNKIAALVSGAPETLDTLDEIAAALSDNKDIVSVLENSIGKKVDTSALTSNYYTESEVNALLNGKSDSDHTHTQYLTLSNIANKQDTISDLEDIRSGAAKGATALQSVPSEYVTETELNGKGYLTSHQNISHLATKAELSGYTTNAEFTSLSEVVNTKSNEGHTHPDYAVKTALATVATTGDYNDLSNKPTIPSEVTESTVSGWGFTKTTGTYSKPNGGIPKTDLSSDVQTSLGKADTALQSVPSEYITESELNGKNYATISQVNSKQDTISDLSTIRSNASNGATAYGWGNHADKGYVTSTSLEQTLTDYVKVNDIASDSDIDSLFS